MSHDIPIQVVCAAQNTLSQATKICVQKPWCRPFLQKLVATEKGIPRSEGFINQAV